MKRFAALLTALVLCVLSGCGSKQGTAKASTAATQPDSESALYTQAQQSGSRMCLYFMKKDYSEFSGAIVTVKNGDNQSDYTTDAGGCADIKNLDFSKETFISVFTSSGGLIGSCRITVKKGAEAAFDNADGGVITFTLPESADSVYSNLVLDSDGNFNSISLN